MNYRELICVNLNFQHFFNLGKLLLLLLLTHSMEQSPSWEDNRFSASQGIPRISWDLKDHYCIHKWRNLSPSWASSFQSILPCPTSWRSILILSSHLHLDLPNGLFPSGFPTKTPICLSSQPYMLHALPISFSILSPEKYLVGNTDH